MYLLYNPYYYKSNKVDISEVVMSVSDGDIMAGVFWNINDTKELQEIILREATDGVRDKVDQMNFIQSNCSLTLMFIFSFSCLSIMLTV